MASRRRLTLQRKLTLFEFARELEGMPYDLEAAILRALRSAAMRGVGFVVDEIDNAQPHPAVDRGELRNSVASESIPEGARLYVDAPHHVFIELGTRPFWPPLAPLAEWALRKGIADDEDEAEDVARAIQRHIATFGIAPRHYLRKGIQRMQLIIPEELERALREI